jgi:hypothetical protein
LAGNMNIEIRRTAGPLPETLDLAMTSSYGDIFDVNGIDPEPTEAYTTEDRVVQRFQAPPGGSAMTVSIDARVQPGVQWHKAKGEVAILDGSGNDLVSVRLSTFVMP